MSVVQAICLALALVSAVLVVVSVAIGNWILVAANVANTLTLLLNYRMDARERRFR